MPVAVLVLLAVVLAPARAWADDVDAPEVAVPAVRVLLMESRGPVRLGDVKVEPAGDGLKVGGRKVGPVYQLAAPDPVRAGDLRVAGPVRVLRASEGLWVVNHVPLEDYVASTVAREVYPGWEPEMLKAQAVVARTYALHERARGGDRPFDLRGGTRSQVYGGVDAITPDTRAATRATRGEYLAWKDEPILAVYHSASGGHTASSEEVWGRALPYLVGGPVEKEEDSPDTYWRAEVSGTTLRRALATLGIRIGKVRELRVVKRSDSGRALRVELRGKDGSESVRGRDLRTALGESVIRSTLFEVHKSGDEFVFAGSGHGHGVGMSQWAAQGMAQAGADYREILASFYPGAVLRRPAR